MQFLAPRAFARMVVFAAVFASPAIALADPTSAPGRVRKTCMAEAHPAGEWPSHGHDLANSRNQLLESAIGPTTVRSLEKAWAFHSGHPSGNFGGGLGDFNGTPIVDGGCVFAAGATGSVWALDADDGSVVWQASVGVETPAYGGAFIASVALSKRFVVALVNQEGAPYAVGFDRQNGAVRWVSEPVSTYPGSFTNANPVIYDDLLIFGFSVPEGDPHGQGGFAIIDATDGEVLARTFTIPEEDQDVYAGGGIWTAPAVDEETGFAYVGSGNPYSKQVEHERTNAILKVDLLRESATFGEIVSSYKGEIDQYHELILAASRPSCALVGEDLTVRNLVYEAAETVETLNNFKGLFADSHLCGQLDFGFGGGVNLFTDAQGRRMVGGLQKSGVYHAALREDMSASWREILGAPCQMCNGASTAYDGEATVFAAVSPGAVMRSLDVDAQAAGWTAPILDVIHYQSVSTANGLVYTIDSGGFLDIFNATTGETVDRRPLFVELGSDASAVSASGVAIARNTVYVASGSYVAAYRLP